MKLFISLDESDHQVIAEYLNSRALGECTSSQHEAIAHQTLTRLVCQAAINHNIQTPAVTAVVTAVVAFHRAKRNHCLPKSRRAKPGRHGI